MKTHTILVIASCLLNNVFGQNAKIDSSFGNYGIVTTSITNNDWANSIALQSDGKIVVAGTVQTGAISYTFGLARYNADGSLDESFAQQGTTLTTFMTSPVWEYSLLIQPDGKLVLTGGTEEHFALVRYNVNGTVDNSFGPDGSGTILSKIGIGGPAVFQSDGKIIMAGRDATGLIIARYTANGLMDSSFAENGVSHASDMAFVNSIVLQTDGKIVTAGEGDYFPEFNRFNVDGTIDSTYGFGGKVTLTSAYLISSLAIQPDGKLIAAGDSLGHIVLLRLNENGLLDSSFNDKGFIIIPKISEVYSVAIQSDGKIIGVGVIEGANSNDGGDFALIRCNVNGSLDSGFGVNGILTTDINGYERANCLAIQTDGKIDVAGSTNGGFSIFVLARYISGLNVGIIDFSVLDNSVFIYPNPVAERAVLEYSLKDEQAVSIRLVSINGEVLKTFTENERQDIGEHKEQITFPSWLSSGSYFIVISDGIGKQVSVKIIK